MSRRPHLAVTDSGFGGLALCARLEVELVRLGVGARISYVNACPADDLGYNQMTTEDRKVRTFAAVLEAIERRLEPDAIVVACNTLSALVDAGATSSRPLRGILDVGARLVADGLAARPEARALVLGTPTTAAARPLDRRLRALGIADGRVDYLACPGLQSVISGDRSGAAATRAIMALAAGVRPRGRGVILLGCTHYSLRALDFARAFGDDEVLDPVVSLADEVVATIRGPAGSLEITFLGRYSPPRREVETIADLLAEVAPRSAAAVVSNTVDPGLFAVAPAD